MVVDTFLSHLSPVTTFFLPVNSLSNERQLVFWKTDLEKVIFKYWRLSALGIKFKVRFHVPGFESEGLLSRRRNLHPTSPDKGLIARGYREKTNSLRLMGTVPENQGPNQHALKIQTWPTVTLSGS